MLVAINQNGDNCISYKTEKGEIFFCPECKKEVILKKGNVKIHHFSHKKKEDCDYFENESKEHLETKMDIYEYLLKQPNVTKCEMERRLKGVRPDVSFCLDGKTYIAVEIQKTRIPCDIIKQRMKRYTKLGIHVIWIHINKNDMKDKEFSNWGRYIRNIQKNRFYYNGKGVLKNYVYFGAIRFSRYRITINEVIKRIKFCSFLLKKEFFENFEIEGDYYNGYYIMFINKSSLEKDFYPSTNHWYKILELKEKKMESGILDSILESCKNEIESIKKNYACCGNCLKYNESEHCSQWLYDEKINAHYSCDNHVFDKMGYEERRASFLVKEVSDKPVKKTYNPTDNLWIS